MSMSKKQAFRNHTPEEEESDGVSELSLVRVDRLDLSPGGDNEGVAVEEQKVSIAVFKLRSRASTHESQKAP